MSTVAELDEEIHKIHAEIKRHEALPDSAWVDIASKKESLFRMGLRELELIDERIKQYQQEQMDRNFKETGSGFKFPSVTGY